MIKYILPDNWIKYDASIIANSLADAKGAVLSLKTVPHQRSWVENLQKMELKMEVAGTSKIEGADFTEKELDEAIEETQEQLKTRSQRQAHAAMQTYKWIATLPDDLPITEDLIKKIHYNIVKNADDDHCCPGKIREKDENVLYGQPRHRGAEGGIECKKAFEGFVASMQNEYQEHDQLVQALATHYHFAAMHPFLDGNGRTARALEALMLQRAGLKNIAFIAMSNYYYDEKNYYLDALNKTRAQQYDLTDFLIFGLKGIALQSKRLLNEIQHEVSKVLFRNMMYDLFTRLKTPRKRVIVERQLEILKVLLKQETIEFFKLYNEVERYYKQLNNPIKALVRDINGLINLQAIRYEKKEKEHIFHIKLEWPTEITETDFFERIKSFSKAKTHSFLT